MFLKSRWGVMITFFHQHLVFKIWIDTEWQHWLALSMRRLRSGRGVKALEPLLTLCKVVRLTMLEDQAASTVFLVPHKAWQRLYVPSGTLHGHRSDGGLTLYRLAVPRTREKMGINDLLLRIFHGNLSFRRIWIEGRRKPFHSHWVVCFHFHLFFLLFSYLHDWYNSYDSTRTHSSSIFFTQKHPTYKHKTFCVCFIYFFDK